MLTFSDEGGASGGGASGGGASGGGANGDGGHGGGREGDCGDLSGIAVCQVYENTTRLQLYAAHVRV